MGTGTTRRRERGSCRAALCDFIHTESSDPEPNTLGQFFVEWGVELSETCVGEHCAPTPIAVYIDGEPYEGDPRAIEITDRKVIVIVVGTPPAVIPSAADFSGA